MVYYCYRNGVSRTGLYCALANCAEQLAMFKEVGVFNNVRIVKKNRPSLVDKVGILIRGRLSVLATGVVSCGMQLL